MSTDHEARLAALEARERTEHRLASGVERLADEAGGLNAILTRVDEQQQRLVALDRRVVQVDHDKADKMQVVESTMALHEERKRNLTSLYRLIAGSLIIALAASVGGAWLTDLHIQECLLHGPNSDQQEALCDATFPGHDHPQGINVDALLARGYEDQVLAAKNSRLGCERTQARVRIEIEKERTLAQNDFPPTHPAHAKAADALQASLVDCNVAYPLPAPVEKDHH